MGMPISIFDRVNGHYGITDVQFELDRFRNEIQKALIGKNGVTTPAEVTNYIRDNISFAVIEAMSYEENEQLKAKMIATVTQCSECQPSEHWLGKLSPNLLVSEQSGLWITQHSYSEPLTEDDLAIIEQQIIK